MGNKIDAKGWGRDPKLGSGTEFRPQGGFHRKNSNLTSNIIFISFEMKIWREQSATRSLPYQSVSGKQLNSSAMYDCLQSI